MSEDKKPTSARGNETTILLIMILSAVIILAIAVPVSLFVFPASEEKAGEPNPAESAIVSPSKFASPHATSTSAALPTDTATLFAETLLPSPTANLSIGAEPSPMHPGLTVYGSPNRVHDILFDPDGMHVWVATDGGVLRWEKAAGTYVRYSRKDGLPDGVTFALFQTGDGRIWACTRSGLGIFEGERWTWMTSGKKLPAGTIESMVLSKEGELWGVFHNGETSDPYRFKDGSWTRYRLHSPDIRNIFVDPKNRLIANTGRMKLSTEPEHPSFVFDGTDWKEDKSIPDTISQIVETQNGEVWSLYKSDYLIDQDGNRFSSDNAPIGPVIFSIKADLEGNLWVLHNTGLTKYSDGVWAKIEESPSANWLIPWADSIAFEADGTRWMGTLNGLVLWMGTEKRVFTAPREPLPYNISALGVGNDNSLWADAAFEGMYRYDGKSWEPAGDPFTPTDPIGHIFKNNDGSMLFLGSKHFYKFSHNQFSVLSTGMDPARQGIMSVDADSQGSLWMIVLDLKTFKVDLYRYAAGKLSKTPIVGMESDEMPLIVTVDKTDGLWIASDYGRLFHKNGNAWSMMDEQQGLPVSKKKGEPVTKTHGIFGSLFVSSDNRIWAGTSEGLFVWSGEGWVKAVNLEPFILQMAETSDHTLVLATLSDGVYFYKDGIVDHLGLADGLPALMISSLTVDQTDSIWIGTILGLCRFKLGVG